MAVRKRNRQDTKAALVKSLAMLTHLLRDQNEAEAVVCLEGVSEVLVRAEPGSKEFKAAIATIIDAFEDEHELMAYTYHRDSNEWTEVEELAQASSRVISLARNFR